METLGPFFRRACYHQNTSYRKTKGIYVVENFLNAFNFGPHGNLGPYFSEGLAMIKTRPTGK
jgi:hypothetical protein